MTYLSSALKTAFLASLVALAGTFAMADTTTPRMGLTQPTTSFADVWGFKYNTTMSAIDSNAAVQSAYNLFTTTNVFNLSVNLPTISPGSCLTTNSTGTVVGQSCGGGGGASSLQVLVGGVSISTPTSVIKFSTNTFRGSLAGAATAQIDLLPTTTYFLQNNASLQSSVFNVSSATVGNLNVTTLTFTTNGSTQTTAINTNSFIQNTSAHQAATINIDSGTIQVLTSSVATVGSQLLVNGTGLTGSSIGMQVMGSTLNVTAQGRVGVGTAAPAKTLDVRGDFSASTATISSVTVNTSLISNGSTFLQNPVTINQVGFGAVSSEIDFKQQGTITGGRIANLWYGGTGFSSPVLVGNTAFADSTSFANLYVDPTYGVSVIGSTNSIRTFSVGQTLGGPYNLAVSSSGVTTVTTLASTSGGTLTNSCGYIIGTVVQSSQTLCISSNVNIGTGYTITGSSASITPLCSTDKVKVSITGNIGALSAVATYMTIYRNGSDLISNGNGLTAFISNGTDNVPVSSVYLDSPSSTSLQLYNVRIKNANGTSSGVWNNSGNNTYMLLEEIAN